MNILNTKTFALILTVENKNAINNQLTTLNNKVPEARDFEKESINCIKAWRKNGGWLKDIPIYIHCPSGDISIETKELYNIYKVNFIHHVISEINNFEYGFINVHYSGLYLSSIIKEDILIHIDLDMELLRPLDINFFDPILKNNYKAIIGGYQKEDYINQRIPIYGDTLLNTDLIITVNNYSEMIYETIINNCIYLNKNNSEIYSNKFRIYDIEEYGADKSYYQLKEYIFIRDDLIYEQGEGYHFFKDPQNLPYFWHEHLKRTINKNLLMQKIKLLKSIKKV